MNEEMEKKIRARKVYDTLCQAIENREWVYDKKEEDLVVQFRVSGDDLPMFFTLAIDEQRQLIRLFSPMTFKISEDKRMEGAIATCVATNALVDGAFDYNLEDGNICFRLNSCFWGSEIGEDVLQYMISCAVATVDDYNDMFQALDKGYLSLEAFINKVNE